MSEEKFRQGIVAVLRNEQGLVLICERADFPGSWQFPQGGIEKDEKPADAFFRELREEIGNDRCKILKTGMATTRYRWKEPGRHGMVGQEQHWFLAEFEGSGEPDLSKSDQCFRAWRWDTPAALLELIFSDKRDAFREGLRMLGLLA